MKASILTRGLNTLELNIRLKRIFRGLKQLINIIIECFKQILNHGVIY